MFSLASDVDIAVTGTPCPPFSQNRQKRTAIGSVVNHPLYHVTDSLLPSWVAMTEPKFAVIEQVKGFHQPMDCKDESTPLIRCCVSFHVAGMPGTQLPVPWP